MEKRESARIIFGASVILVVASELGPLAFVVVITTERNRNFAMRKHGVGKIAPGGFGLAMHILQQRDAQQAVKRMDADFAVGPVMHRSPSEPLTVFQAAEDEETLKSGMIEIKL
jgi:hypothetical protein